MLNISGIISLVAALGLIVYGIMGDQGLSRLMNFYDFASVMIVVGGSFAATIFSFPWSVVSKVPKMLSIAFKPPKFKPEKYVEDMVEYCKTARMKGILALEEAANQCTDPFMKSSLMLIVDANDSEKVRSMLDDAINNMCERHDANAAIWSRASAVAPAMGMIGTLVGLVNMLKEMDPTDPDSAALLGMNMSTALITTFYGCILAHCFFTPIGMLVQASHADEVLCMSIVEEGTLAIISGANPRYVEEKLKMMLPTNGAKKKGKKGKEEAA
ncbi:MAG: MotA/TolQ/ExbB proton channel family protein [Ruminococcus sp.]|jgi:chemotaxis protein MotA|nr:MotA/TolQ/ExbB proton channel family protein [Ruminococcus sp.]